MSSLRAVIAGGGIGGLAAAVALHQRGFEVLVLERRAEPAGGVALSLWPNALRALDRLGVGDRLRGHGALAGASGVRRPDGRWLARSNLGSAITARYGDPLVLVRRSTLVESLLGQLPESAVRYGVTATGVSAGGSAQPAVLHAGTDGYEADLVVAADGISSALRGQLFPAADPPRYAGYTAWRMLVPDPGNAGSSGTQSAETWGPDGQRFAILPLADGNCYCYATALRPAASSDCDEIAELRRRFGDWHQPIPAVLDSLTGTVLRNDIYTLPPLPALHRGRVALLGDAAHAMTPDLGQGGCQALEDAVELATAVSGNRPIEAALSDYTARRLPRTSAIVRRSAKAGALYTRPLPAQYLAARLLGRLPASLIARGLKPVLDWQPPASP